MSGQESSEDIENSPCFDKQKSSSITQPLNPEPTKEER